MCEHHPQQQSLPFCLSTRSDEANCKVAHTGVCVYISLLGHAIRFRGHVVCLVRDRDVRRPVNINCLLPFCFTHTNPAGCQTTTQQGHLPGKARKQKWNYRLMDGIQGRKMMDQWKDKAKLENKKNNNIHPVWSRLINAARQPHLFCVCVQLSGAQKKKKSNCLLHWGNF